MMISTYCDHPTCDDFTQISALGGAAKADSGTCVGPIRAKDSAIVTHMLPENGFPEWPRPALKC
jgi:hypothetical protein